MAEEHAFSARSTREFVVDQVRKAIIEGRLPSGSRLGQDQLRAEFAASAAPDPRSLAAARKRGLVVHYPNRGSFVAGIDADELRGLLLPVRLHLERHAAHHAIAEDSSILWAELDEIVSDMYSAAECGHVRDVTEADVRFHRTLVGTAHSVHTSQLWAGIEARVRMQFHLLGQPQRRLRAIADEHCHLLEALHGGIRSSVDAELETTSSAPSNDYWPLKPRKTPLARIPLPPQPD